MEELSLRSCRLNNDSCLILTILFKGLPAFHTLDLSDDPKVSDDGCRLLLSSIKFMATGFINLHLPDCSGISSHMKEKLAKACQRNLTISCHPNIVKEKLATSRQSESYVPEVVAAVNPIIDRPGDVLPEHHKVLCDVIRVLPQIL